MNILRLAAGLVIALLQGYLIVDMILGSRFRRTWLKAAYAFGIGLGFSSLTFFLWRLFDLPANFRYVIFDMLVVVVLALVRFAIARVRGRGMDRTSPRGPGGSLEWGWLRPVTLTCLALAAVTFVSGSLVFPHGGWDAWAIWNLSGRFLFSGASDWRAFFDPAVLHSEYPLLMGGNAARLWTYRGAVNFAGPAAVSLAFFTLIFVLLASLASLARGRSAAWLAALVLLTSSLFIIMAPSQTADIPLSFYLLAGAGAFYLYERERLPRYHVLAGVCLGLGVWTKNEGFLLILAALVAHFAAGAGVRGWVKDSAALLAGALPAIGAALYQKLALAPPNDLVAAQSAATISGLLDVSRWAKVGAAFGAQFFTLETKAAVPIGLVMIALFAIGLREGAFEARTLRMLTILVPFILAGEWIVYLLSPYDLDWHLRTSLSRLYLHVWPAFVFAGLLAVRLPVTHPRNRL